MEEEIKSIIKRVLDCKLVKVETYITDYRYKCICRAFVSAKGKVEDDVADMAYEDVQLEMMEILQVDTYNIWLDRKGSRFDIGMTFFYKVPINERVTRKSMLTLLKSELR